MSWTYFLSYVENIEVYPFTSSDDFMYLCICDLWDSRANLKIVITLALKEIDSNNKVRFVHYVYNIASPRPRTRRNKLSKKLLYGELVILYFN